MDNSITGEEYFRVKIPREHVVLLQAIVESYEGIGVVRTVGEEKEEVILEVLTTADQADTCGAVLRNVVADIWKGPSQGQESCITYHSSSTCGTT